MLLSRRRLPLNAMRAFEAAARHCHLRRAAEELGVSHGAVSRQVKQLEELLGVELFDRSHNRLALSSAGQHLLVGVSDALDKLTETVLYLNPESVSGSLVIASTPSIGAGWLVAVIGEFSRKYPDVQIQLLDIEPLQRDIPSDVEVSICYGRPLPGQRSIRALFKECYFPVAHRSLLQSGPAIEQPRDLLKFPLLHDRHGHWPSWFSQFGIDTPDYRQLYFEDSFQVLTAIRGGFGIGLVDKIDVDQELRSGQLVALFDDTVEAAESHYLVMDDDARSTIRAKLFAEHLCEYLNV